MFELALYMLVAALALAWFIHGLTRPRDMREDQYRSGGEFDGNIDVKKWHEEE